MHMTNRLKSLIVPFALAAGFTAGFAACGGSGGGSLSIEEAFEGQFRGICEKAHECRDSYPGEDADFVAEYGESADDCYNEVAPFISLAVTAAEQSVDSGRADYDGDAAGECVDLIEGVTCEQFYADEPPPGYEVCDEIFTGNVADGGDCEQDIECAEEGSECSAETETCEPV
jgi:hypothetical protein